MDLAAVRILLLSQGNQSLEAHTQAFLELQHLVHYDDASLCVFGGDEHPGSFKD